MYLTDAVQEGGLGFGHLWALLAPSRTHATCPGDASLAEVLLAMCGTLADCEDYDPIAERRESQFAFYAAFCLTTSAFPAGAG